MTARRYHRPILPLLSATLLAILSSTISYTAPEAQAAVIAVPVTASQTLLDASGGDLSITMCSCVKYARTKLPGLPLINTPADLQPNATPAKGVAVLLDYQLAHIAIVTSLEEDGFWIIETNFRMCQKTTRFIDWNDPHIRGFWAPR